MVRGCGGVRYVLVNRVEEINIYGVNDDNYVNFFPKASCFAFFEIPPLLFSNPLYIKGFLCFYTSLDTSLNTSLDTSLLPPLEN